MDATCIAIAALSVADDPTHGVAGGDGSRTRELLARFEGNVSDLAGGDVDLVQGTRTVGEDLHGIEVSVAARFDSRSSIGNFDPVYRLSSLDRASFAAPCGRPGRRDMQRS